MSKQHQPSAFGGFLNTPSDSVAQESLSAPTPGICQGAGVLDPGAVTRVSQRGDLPPGAGILVASYLAQINTAASHEALGSILAAVYRAFGQGELRDADAEFLDERVAERRRPRSAPGVPQAAIVTRNRISIFPAKRHRPRRADPARQERWLRKRRLGGFHASLLLPASVALCLTEGERAAAFIVANECLRQGFCELSVAELADRAGVGWSTVRNFLRLARLRGFLNVQPRPQFGAKHKTNRITVLSKDWNDLLVRRRATDRGRDRVQFVKKSGALDSQVLNNRSEQQRGNHFAEPKPGGS